LEARNILDIKKTKYGTYYYATKVIKDARQGKSRKVRTRISEQEALEIMAQEKMRKKLISIIKKIDDPILLSALLKVAEGRTDECGEELPISRNDVRNLAKFASVAMDDLDMLQDMLDMGGKTFVMRSTMARDGAISIINKILT